jgi:hypothetical protein
MMKHLIHQQHPTNVERHKNGVVHLGNDHDAFMGGGGAEGVAGAAHG